MHSESCEQFNTKINVYCLPTLLLYLFALQSYISFKSARIYIQCKTFLHVRYVYYIIYIYICLPII